MEKPITSDQFMSPESPMERRDMSRIIRTMHGENSCLITLTHTGAI